MTDMWKIVTATIVSGDGTEAYSYYTADNGGDVAASTMEARDGAIERYTENIGSLGGVPYRIVIQVVEMPEPKHHDTVVTATLGEIPAEAPVSFTAA